MKIADGMIKKKNEWRLTNFLANIGLNRADGIFLLYVFLHFLVSLNVQYRGLYKMSQSHGCLTRKCLLL